MRDPIAKIRNFLRSEEGVTTVEYAVAGALISVAIVTAFTTLRGAIVNAINQMIALIGG